MGQMQYCRPEGSALSTPVKTCRPGSAPKGCFFYLPFNNSVALGANEDMDFAPVQPSIAVDMVGQNSHADIDLVDIRYPAQTAVDSWLAKEDPNFSTADTGWSDAMGIPLVLFTSDIRDLNPWPTGLPPAFHDAPMRMRVLNNNAGAQQAEGWITWWVPQNVNVYKYDPEPVA